jgi:arginase
MHATAALFVRSFGVRKRRFSMDISLICVPFQGDVSRWGCARGPQAILDAGLIERLETLGHRLRQPLWIELPKEERTRDSVTNLGNIADRTAQAVHGALRQTGGIVVVLEGDCSHALGALGGLARSNEAPGIVWFDAHGDLCTMETTTSGFLGGMPFAVALGWEFPDWREAAGLEVPVRAEAAALIGASDLDPAELEVLSQYPILNLDATELAAPGVGRRVERALKARLSEATAWYVHIDVDVAGPEVVPGGMTPAPSWAQREHLLEAAEGVAHAVPVSVVSLAAYNPAGDPLRQGALFGIDMLMSIVQHINRLSTQAL